MAVSNKQVFFSFAVGLATREAETTHAVDLAEEGQFVPEPRAGPVWPTAAETRTPETPRLPTSESEWKAEAVADRATPLAAEAATLPTGADNCRRLRRLPATAISCRTRLAEVAPEWSRKRPRSSAALTFTRTSSSSSSPPFSRTSTSGRRTSRRWHLDGISEDSLCEDLTRTRLSHPSGRRKLDAALLVLSCFCKFFDDTNLRKKCRWKSPSCRPSANLARLSK